MTEFFCSAIVPRLGLILMGATVVGIAIAFAVQNKFGWKDTISAMLSMRGSMFRSEPHIKRSAANIVFLVGMLSIFAMTRADFSACYS